MRTPSSERTGLDGIEVHIGAIAVALVVVALGAPVALRALVALPVLLLAAGASATRLLLGARTPRTARDDAGDSGPDAIGETGGVVGTPRDGVLRGSLTVVLGMLVLLASVLVSQAAGVPLAGSGVLVGAGVAALVLTLVAQVRRADGPTYTGSLAYRLSAPAVLGVAATVVVLAGAVTFAASLPTPVTERYTLLAFTGTQPWSATSLTAPPGATVTLDVALHSYGEPLDAGVPQTTLTVAGAPADGLGTSWQAVAPAPATTGGTVPGAVDQRTGQLVFRAPSAPGLYPVEVRASSAPDATLLLTTYLQVSS